MIGLRGLYVPALAMAVFGLLASQLGYLDAMPKHLHLLPTPDHSGFANVNGIKMWYAVYNPHGGSPVILLHGGLGSSRDWANQIPALTPRHMVVITDSRGQGRSTRSDAPIGYDLMSSDVLALMDHLKIAQAAIVGWSDGGIIGLDIAMHHPDRVSKLLAYGANYNVDGLLPSPYSGPPPPVGESALAAMDEHTRTVHDVMAMWYSQPDFKPDELGSIKVPTEIVDGDREEAIKPEHTRELARLIPGAKLVIMEGVGHAGMLQDPVDFNAIMTNFLDGPNHAVAANPSAPSS